jgi:hypothetical protein
MRCADGPVMPFSMEPECDRPGQCQRDFPTKNFQKTTLKKVNRSTAGVLPSCRKEACPGCLIDADEPRGGADPRL